MLVAAVLAGGAGWFAVRAPAPTRSAARSTARRTRWLPLLAFGVVLLPSAPIALGLIAGGAAWGGVALWRGRRRRVLISTTRGEVAEACSALAGELAAGAAPWTALARASQIAPVLAAPAEAQALGGDVPQALRRAAEQPGAESLTLLAGGWTVAHRTGAGLADGVGAVADLLRAERDTARLVDGELASARATARLVALLPLAALAMGSGAGGDPVGFLLGPPAGLACLAGGLALALLGLWWIERLCDDR